MALLVRALVLLLLVSSPAWADRTLRLVVTVEPAAALDETVDAVGRRLDAWGTGKATRHGDELVIEAAGLRDDEVASWRTYVIDPALRMTLSPVAPRPPCTSSP